MTTTMPQIKSMTKRTQTINRLERQRKEWEARQFLEVPIKYYRGYSKLYKPKSFWEKVVDEPMYYSFTVRMVFCFLVGFIAGEIIKLIFNK